jgi:hypothetical protein
MNKEIKRILNPGGKGERDYDPKDLILVTSDLPEGTVEIKVPKQYVLDEEDLISLFDQMNRRDRRARRTTRSLSCLSHVIPKPLRADWLEEQHAYLLDLPTRWSRIRWVASACVGLPRLLVAMRAEVRKESA